MHKIKPTIAFAAYNAERGFGLNPYWIKAQAKDIRASADWKRIRKDGWRVVKVKVIAIGNPK